MVVLVPEKYQSHLCKCTAFSGPEPCNIYNTVFITSLPSTPAERRRPSIQAVNPIMSDYGSQCDTPLSSVSNYKHHMLSSSTGETGTPIYDRLCDLQKDGDSESEGRNGSVSSDGADGQDSCSNGQVQAVQRVVVDMYSSEGKIDSVVHNFAAGNGASAQPSPPPPSRPSQLYPPHLHSSAGQLQVKSTHSLYQPIQLQVTRQKLPSSLHQLPLVQRGISPQHLLPPPTFSVGSSPAVSNVLEFSTSFSFLIPKFSEALRRGGGGGGWWLANPSTPWISVTGF